MRFAWSQDKATSNQRKHNVTFEEASSVFADALSLVIEDMLHSEEEVRSIIVGLSVRQRLLVVVYTETGNTTRIISARLATARERKQYEQGT